MKCWGFNDSGQLGDGTTTDRSTPVAVKGLPGPVAKPRQTPVAVTVGAAHTCVLLKDNSARCWGDNSTGQLGYQTADADGDELMDPSRVPNLVRHDADPNPLVENLQPLYGMTTISAGLAHTCALTANGSGRCWGSNGASQLLSEPRSGEANVHAGQPIEM